MVRDGWWKSEKTVIRGGGSREFHVGGDQEGAKRRSHEVSREEVSQNRGPKRWQHVCAEDRARRNSKHQTIKA